VKPDPDRLTEGRIRSAIDGESAGDLGNRDARVGPEPRERLGRSDVSTSLAELDPP
jgi:hypothetical protein